MPLFPEPFRSLIAAGRLLEAGDLRADDAPALFARAQARMLTGHDADARADLEACLPEMGDRARVELIYLDVRGRGAVEAQRSTLLEICARAAAAKDGNRDGDREPFARAKHVLGLVEGKLRNSEGATAALLEAAEVYRSANDQAGLAQVHDTLGSVFAAQGRLDYAVGHYALSLVAKQRVGDKYGTALTLGNLGRVHLRSGRFLEAIDAFRLDLDLATDLGDARGRARMHEDIGRAWLGLGRLREAEEALQSALAVALERGYRLLEFFARKDLALVFLRTEREAEATRELDHAESALQECSEPYLQTVLFAARAQLARAQGRPEAPSLLEEACRRFADADLPDHEIPTLVALANARAERGDKHAAESALLRATTRARRDGYARYLPQIREEMERLRVVSPLIEETGRLIAPQDPGQDITGEAAIEPGQGVASAPSRAAPVPARTDGYVLLEALGKGGFGEVFRAYDPQRGEVVAIKRFVLERLYDPTARRRLLASARMELDAASRVRHPGVARVLAIGTDPLGRTYVVQEFVPGVSLRKRLPRAPTAEVALVLETVGLIAGALHALHAAGVVHRDLKPENVLMRSPEDLPVLIDFGIARIPSGALDDGFISGTIAYMAPEQAAGQAVDGAADVYSLGVILYEWLTGVRPLKPRSNDIAAIADELFRRIPPPITEWRTDLPAEVVELVGSLLEKDPRDRMKVQELVDVCSRCARGPRRRSG